jgi:hypothetical protein
LARHDRAFDEVATKFFEHFLAIAEAMETFGSRSSAATPTGAARCGCPSNVLLTDALRTYAAGMGADLQIEFPTDSGQFRGIGDAAAEIDSRLVGLFRIGADGRRPSDPRHVPTGPLWQAHPTFSEYFHGDTGAGLGASHQTGWTALVAHLICLRED